MVAKDREVQQWGRWYSQAPVGGRYFRNKKTGSSSTGRKKTPTYGTAHPSTTDDAVRPPPTHRPNLYYIQQYSSAAIHLTGEQQPIRFLQCSRAGRDSQLFNIPRHAGGQAKKRSRCRFCARRTATARRCCDWGWCCRACC